MRWFHDSLACLLACLSCAVGLANARDAGQQPLLPNSSPFTEDFEGRVNRTLERWHVPGMSIGVVDDDHTWTEVALRS
jgi:hypothetical protein